MLTSSATGQLRRMQCCLRETRCTCIDGDTHLLDHHLGAGKAVHRIIEPTTHRLEHGKQAAMTSGLPEVGLFQGITVQRQSRVGAASERCAAACKAAQGDCQEARSGHLQTRQKLLLYHL